MPSVKPRPRTIVYATGGAAALLIGAWALSATAQAPERSERAAVAARIAEPLERFDQPPAPAPASVRTSQPRIGEALRRVGPAVRIAQVNVNALHLNILGDAGNEPSIAVSPIAHNRMAIGWRQFDSVASSFRQAGYAFSQDGGRNWTFPGKLEPGVFRSDPVLRSNADGTFFYNSLRVTGGSTFAGFMFISTDGGQTWGGSIPAVGGDKVWFAADRTGGIGRGNLYQAWNTAANPFGASTFSRSTNGAASWMTPITIPQRPIFGTLAVGPDGELYVAGQNSSGALYVIKSINAQNSAVTPTFPQIVAVNMGGEIDINITPNPVGLAGQLWIDVDRSNGPRRGWVYLFGSLNPMFVDPMATDPLDVMFSRSTDAGLTWSPPLRVNDDAPGTNAFQWFGTMAVAPNGRIDAVWNDTRADPSGATSVMYYASSSDGGTTWTPNAPLTSAFNSLVGFPQQSKIGDYYDLNSDLLGADLACAATFNGEQDVYYIRIGDDDCNANGIPDSADIAAGTSRDCNANAIPDECDIAAGLVLDTNANGIPNPCEIPVCLADTNRDGVVNFADVTAVFAHWANTGVAGRVGDANGDGAVDFADITAVFTNWGGTCP